MTHTLGRARLRPSSPTGSRRATACSTSAAATATLLRHLIDTRGVHGWGVEIDDDNVLAAIRNGINVIQGNLERPARRIR